MQRRLFERLGDWAVMADDAAGERRSPSSTSRSGDLRRAPARLFARALETPGGLKIQTIHAFCEKLLRRFPLEAGVSPGFRVLEDAAAPSVAAQARERLARARARRRRSGRSAAAYAPLLGGARLPPLRGDVRRLRGRARGRSPPTSTLRRPDWRAPTSGSAAASTSRSNPRRWSGRGGGARSTGPPGAARPRRCSPAARASDVRAAARRCCALDADRRPSPTSGRCSAPPRAQPRAKCSATKASTPARRAWLEREQARLAEARRAGPRRARIAADTVHALTLAGGLRRRSTTAPRRRRGRSTSPT